jgi:type IV secretory pathway TrbD component
MQENIPTVIIHKSLIRKQLVLGAEKVAIKYLSIFVTCLALPAMMNVWREPLFCFLALCLALLFWCLGLFLLRLLAKHDRQFFSILLRCLSYQKTYTAKTQGGFVQKWNWHRNYKN